MDTSAVVLSALLGLLVGWFVVVPVVERIPEPAPLDRRAQVAATLVNAVLWGLVADHFTRWWAVLVYFVAFSALLAVSIVDLRIYRIPDRIVFPSLALTAALVVIASWVLAPDTSITFDAIKFAVAGMLTYFLILFAFHLVSPRGMGFGDVKLALLMGLAIGWRGESILDAVYYVFIAIFL